MNILYEEDGTYKVATVMTDNVTSLQVESPHGKRSKIKAATVVLKFSEPRPAEFLDQAHAAMAELDADFLWEFAGSEEFSFLDLAREYAGKEPDTVTAAAVLLTLHAAPMHFYKKGRGRFKPATPEALQSARAAQERKRQQAETIAGYVQELSQFRLPQAFHGQVERLLYKPDKNSLEYKALEQAAEDTHLRQPHLLEKCGGIPSSHDYHLNRFLLENFPAGAGFPELPPPQVTADALPLAEVAAFSIDDASTTEIDDAFSVRKLAEGRWQIGIHIAAPGLMTPESDWDQVAQERLSTVYMPGSKITMLPEPVVEQFTLKAGEAPPALSLYMEVTEDGWQVEQVETRLERLPVAANLRHETLEPLFNRDTLYADNGDYPFRQELHLLWEVASQLERGRGKDDAKNQFEDYNFVIENDRVTITERVRGTPIDKLVSELMIFANARWAEQLARQEVAGIYRVQKGGKVRMTTAPGPHQGLGVEYYAWTTSPLRRFVDLLNQRQLIALATGQPAPYAANHEGLLAAMRNFETAYDAYNAFQRQMERYWVLRYLLQEGTQQLTGTVVRENLVKVAGLPLTVKVPSLPDLPVGQQVTLDVGAIDLLDLEVSCRFNASTETKAVANG
jgi:exoribonuclease II